MDRGLAINILNLDSDFDQDELDDAYDEALFTVKRFFLQNQVIESLWIKKNLRLSQIQLAYEVLNGHEIELIAATILNKVPNKIENYYDYEVVFYELKKHLSNCLSCRQAIEVSKEMIKLERLYNEWFIEIVKNHPTTKHNLDLRLNQKLGREILTKLNGVYGNYNEFELQQIALEKDRIEKLLTIK